MLYFLSSYHIAQEGCLRLCILFIVLCQLLVTLFRLISLQSMRFITFSIGTTFLLPPISFVTGLKLSKPCIHTSEWVQYSTPGLFFLCEWRCVHLLVPISCPGDFFAFTILDAISVLMPPSFNI